MIPIRDESRAPRIGWICGLIILLNAGIFGFFIFASQMALDAGIQKYGLVPAELMGHVRGDLLDTRAVAVGKIFSSMFMHGGFFHLVSNMWFLWIFGPTLEARLGHRRFFVFYVLCGVLASLAHVYSDPNSTIPMVGASGALSGVLGGYFILFPHHRILTIIFIFFYFTTVRIPAGFFLGFWFLLQVLYSMSGGAVAWYAHIGGFLAGFVLVLFFLLPIQRKN